MQIYFRRFAEVASALVGSVGAFLLAVVVIVVWAVSGPLFGFSNTWQLVINTGTTIITFLMVFLIQNTQNRDSRAIHLKLDELLHAQSTARDEMVDLEDLTDDELRDLQKEFRKVHEEAQRRSSKGLKQASDTLDEVSSHIGPQDASHEVRHASENLDEASGRLEKEAVPRKADPRR
jgi:low affinity Fe/Cu permease